MYYKDLIITDHGLEQLKARKLDLEQIWKTFKYSDHNKKGKKANTFEYKKAFDGFTITLIVVQNERFEWVLVTAWREPPLPGTKDAAKRARYKKFQKAGPFGKLFILILEQFGL